MRATDAMRAEVVGLAAKRCEYCRSPQDFSTQPFSIDHITPMVKGGDTVIPNLALACQGCNGYKYTKIKAADPVTGKIVALFHPRQHRWGDHFSWDETCCRLIGMTPTGRATIHLLRLNRSEFLNLRRVLVGFGEHP